MQQQPYGYNEPYRVRKEHHWVRRVILVIVLVIVAYIACLGVSAYNMYGSASTLRNQYTELSREISGHDYDGAASTALSMGDTAASLASESQTWPWQLAAKIPYVQDDVTVVQGLVSCAQSLTSGALGPIAQAYQQLVADGVVQSGSVSLRALATHQEDVVQLQQAVSSALAALQTSESAVEELPSSHIAALNSAKDSLASSLSDATSSLGTLGSTASSSSVLSLLS